MSHELTQRKDGMVEHAYVGEVGWHGLGQQLQEGASIEEWRKAAGMDYDVRRSRVRYGEGDNQRIMEEAHVLFRSDTKEPLGIVSPKYKIVQPGEVLEFFRDLSAGAGFKLDTAGTLFGGRKYWALASIGESAVIANPADIVGGYLLLTTTADGTGATTGKFTTVRVVCNNTLSMAMSRKDRNQVSVSHKQRFDPGAMKDQLGIARGQFGQFIQTMRQFSAEKLSKGAAEDLTLALLKPEDASPDQVDKVKESRAYKGILKLFDGAGIGSQLSGVQGTEWGWLNAVTEHIDHNAHAHSADGRMDSAFFGKGDELKTKAVELLIA